MTINLKMPDIRELKPRITVFGVGGAGGNAVNNMIRSGLQGCEFVVANTDSQALTSSRAERLIQMGVAVTEGLVGRVVTVGRNISRAQLLIDASAAVGARIVRTGETGVVKGDGRGGMRLNNIPTTSHTQAGDLVESAGIDGIYPRGVAIGRVSSVARGSSLFLEIRVAPAAAFSQLTDVLVLAPSPAVTESPGGGRSATP